MYIADLHIHSKYSRATSRDCDAPHLELWARYKGIGLVGTGDFTHPVWREELREQLRREEGGLYVLKDEYRLPEALDYDAAARTLALADPRWNSQPALYAALRLSREPYLPAQLAVTSAELTAAHIRGGRQAWVLRGLLDAVIAAPQINFPEALLALAKTLAGQA